MSQELSVATSIVSSSFNFDGIRNGFIIYVTSGMELMCIRTGKSPRTFSQTCVECVHENGVDIPVASPDPFAC
jgi:hypothetical protein